MIARPRPKFPNRTRRLRQHLLYAAAALGVLLLAGAVCALSPRMFSPRPVESASLPSLAEEVPNRASRKADHEASRASAAPSTPGAQTREPFAVSPSVKADVSPGPLRPAAPPDRPAPLAAEERPAPPLTANTPSLWGQPFVGYSLEEIRQELSGTYGKRVPKKWGEDLEGVVTRLPVAATAERPVLALTLDACGGAGGSGYDESLIRFLRERNIPATLFITNTWAKKNAALLRELAEDELFEIAGHGARHKPCSINGHAAYGISGTANLLELLEETEGNARELQRMTGRRPAWFRSGTAFYDEVAVDVIGELGLRIAGYSIAADEGATLPAARVAAKVLAARHGDIILAHMNRPASGTAAGLSRALPVLLERGAIFVRLSDLAAPHP